MKQIAVLLWAVCIGSLGVAANYQDYRLYNGDTINVVDMQGKKQGYWRITGEMRNLPEYSPSDVVEEGEYKSSRRIGIWKKYFPGNKIKSEVEYQGGRPNGLFKVYYESGQVEEEGRWSSSGRGKYQGNFKRYHLNGNVAQEKNFNEAGKTDGAVKYYHENGQLELEFNTVGGIESGPMKRYFANGDIKEEKVFNNGQVEEGSVKRYEPSQPVVEIKEAPVEKVEHKDVVPDTESKPNLGQLNCNGYNKLFNRNRQVTQDGVFKKCKLWNGKWHRYDSNGLLISIEIWKKGEYVGEGVIEE